MNNKKRRYNINKSLEAFDEYGDGENRLSRIFIEPPDEAATSCEESDEESNCTPTAPFKDCEIVLQNGKRYSTRARVSSKKSCEGSKPVNNCTPTAPFKDCEIVPQNGNRYNTRARVSSKKSCEGSKPVNKLKRNLIDKQEKSCDKSPEANIDSYDPKSARKPKHKSGGVPTHAAPRIKSFPGCNGDKSGKIKDDKQHIKTKNNDFVWTDDVAKTMIPIFPTPNYTDCTGNTAVDQFEKFFDNDLLGMIVEESTKYAAYLGKPDPKITIAELKVYIGILIISGYSVQPRLESYWSSDPDLRNELICKSMRKNRFKQISQFLHFKDLNEPQTGDKIWKLRPLTDHLKQKMLANFHAEQNLSFDESMIEYYGRHGMKQCMKEKPVPFGFKVWSLCTVAGYLVNFEIYQGKNPRSKTEYEERFGKCIAPLFNMIDDFEDGVRTLPFSFYFDNLFTGIPALAHLKSLGYNGTGTIRENRLPQGCPLKEKKKVVAKKGRGFMASKSIKGMDIHITQWVDNSVVRVASTVFGKEPTTSALRYSAVEKKKIEVPRPFVVANYNKNMGGVDRMDENISLYRISIHGKKWWSCIFTWMVDVCIQNGWQLHRIAHPEMPQFDFRREIATYYCGHYGVPPKSTGNRKRKMEDKDYSSLRYDNLSHWPQRSKRRRCALETCNSSVRTMCGKCNVGLCIDCFECYHSFEKFKH